MTEETAAQSADDDFYAQMHCAVFEECTLWELPLGSTDMLPTGNVVHGPWSPEMCARVLSTWVTEGWVELYVPPTPGSWELAPALWRERATEQNGFLVLIEADTMELLANPRRWTLGSEDGQVSLSVTPSGQALEYPDWAESARRSA